MLVNENDIQYCGTASHEFPCPGDQDILCSYVSDFLKTRGFYGVA